MRTLVTNTRRTATMTTMSTTQAAPKINYGIGVTSLVLGIVALAIAGFFTTWWAVIIGGAALLFGIFTFKKDSVKALPLIGMTLATLAIIATTAMMTGAA